MSDIQRFRHDRGMLFRDDGEYVLYRHHAKAIAEKDREIERLKGGWISVDDRLPGRGIQVLVLSPNEPEWEGHKPGPTIATGWLCSSYLGGFDTMHDLTKHYPITHWHPLPPEPTDD